MSPDERGPRDLEADPAARSAELSRVQATDAVVQTLRELGMHLDGWADTGAHGGDSAVADAPLADVSFAPGVAGDEQDALLGYLGVDAVIDTNATVSQQSLREFLR